LAELMLAGLVRDMPLADLSDSSGALEVSGVPSWKLYEEVGALASAVRLSQVTTARAQFSADALSRRLPATVEGFGATAIWAANTRDLGAVEPAVDQLSFSKRLSDAPGTERSMSQWMGWLKRTYGMSGAKPVQWVGDRSCADISRHLLGQAPERPFLCLAHRLLELGAPFAPGLGHRLNTAVVFHSVTEAARTAMLRARRKAAKRKALVRPAEMAARLSLADVGALRGFCADHAMAEEALSLLSQHCGALLMAVHRFNVSQSGQGLAVQGRDGAWHMGWSPVPLQRVLMLPRLKGEASVPLRDDSLCHAAGASAAAEVLRGLFREDAKLIPLSGPGGHALGTVLDGALSAIRLAHRTEAKLYPHEVEADIVIGRQVAAEQLEALPETKPETQRRKLRRGPGINRYA
jgi:hypothetical protein